MWLATEVTECDFTGRKYDKPVNGAYALAQGATGRVCPVMVAGPEYLADVEANVMTLEEVEANFDNVYSYGWLEA